MWIKLLYLKTLLISIFAVVLDGEAQLLLRIFNAEISPHEASVRMQRLCKPWWWADPCRPTFPWVPVLSHGNCETNITEKNQWQQHCLFCVTTPKICNFLYWYTQYRKLCPKTALFCMCVVNFVFYLDRNGSSFHYNRNYTYHFPTKCQVNVDWAKVCEPDRLQSKWDQSNYCATHCGEGGWSCECYCARSGKILLTLLVKLFFIY